MDLMGVQQRYEAVKGEQGRIVRTANRANPLSIEQRDSATVDAFRRICQIAEWHGGKGPRSKTNPIVLAKMHDGGVIQAQVTSYDYAAEPCHYGRATDFEVSVSCLLPNGSGMPQGEEYFRSGGYAYGVGLDVAEQSVDMLLMAIRDPDLNPQFQDQLVQTT